MIARSDNRAERHRTTSNTSTMTGAKVSKLFATALDIVLAITVLGAAAYGINSRFPQDKRLAQSDWRQITIGRAILSSPSTRDTLVEFIDYQCPSCARLEMELLNSLSDSEPRMHRIIRHFPLPYHEYAVAAATVAECAAVSLNTYAPMHRLLLEKQDSLGTIPWTSLALRAGVRDTVAFANCVADPSVAAHIQRDIAIGKSAGVTGTPSFFFNRRIVPAQSGPALRTYLLKRSRDNS